MSLGFRALRPVLWFLCGAALVFGGQFLIDVWLGGASPGAEIATPERANILVTGLSRSSNQLVALVLTSVALAVPLTANMYTPKLIELFIAHPVNQVCLPLFVFTMAQANFALYSVGGGLVPRVQIAVLLVSQLACYVLLVPYFHFVIRFVDPGRIVDRVEAHARRTLARVRQGRLAGDRAKDAVVAALADLDHIALRAIDRGDRDVATRALWGIRRIVREYGAVKAVLPEPWFRVDKRFFPGLSPEALALLDRDRVWVERRCLGELEAAFLPALSKMPAIVSAITDITRAIALDGRAAGDSGVLRLGIRQLNTLLREAVKARHVHAAFDILQGYKGLALELLPSHPDEVVRLAGYLGYYGQVALTGGVPMVLELAAYDLGEVVGAAAATGGPTLQALLDRFLALRPPAGAPLSVRLVKARVRLAASLLRAGREVEAGRIVDATRPVAEDTRAAVRQGLLETDDPYFWEITDRQVDLDYTRPEERAGIQAVLDRLVAATLA